MRLQSYGCTFFILLQYSSTSDLHLAYTVFKDLQDIKGLVKLLSLAVTHLSESGGTFIEARLTWVRLNAELKNCRKVGRESLAFLQK